MTGSKHVSVSCFEGKDGTMIMDHILKRWQEYMYIGDLFKDNRREKKTSKKNSDNVVLEDEINKVLKRMTTGKVPGPDGTIVEIFTALGDFGVDCITRFANRINEAGRFPTDICKSIFIAIPKKLTTTKYELLFLCCACCLSV